MDVKGGCDVVPSGPGCRTVGFAVCRCYPSPLLSELSTYSLEQPNPHDKFSLAPSCACGQGWREDGSGMEPSSLAKEGTTVPWAGVPRGGDGR